MSRFMLLSSSILVLMLLSSSVFASPIPVTIPDAYWGSNDHGYGDVIGNANVFGISSMVVSLSGDLVVDIFTPYVQQIGALGTGLGDLFISTHGWQPYGNSPYPYDNASNGTSWDYVLRFDNYPALGTSAGAAGLYAVNPSGIVLSFAPSGYIYRNGQEVRYNPIGGQGPILGGTWSIYVGAAPNQDYLRFSVPASIFQGVTDFGFHWGMTCANDVIEGGATLQTPEPGSIILLGTGLLGIAIFAKKKLRA